MRRSFSGQRDCLVVQALRRVGCKTFALTLNVHLGTPYGRLRSAPLVPHLGLAHGLPARGACS